MLPCPESVYNGWKPFLLMHNLLLLIIHSFAITIRMKSCLSNCVNCLVRAQVCVSDIWFETDHIVFHFFRRGGSCLKHLEWSPHAQSPIFHNHHPANEPSSIVFNQPFWYTSHKTILLPLDPSWSPCLSCMNSFFSGLQQFQPKILQRHV